MENLQNTITSKLKKLEGGAKFEEDLWKRPEDGGGRARVIENGAIFKKDAISIANALVYKQKL
ncbi:coproporphyrinogen III oxidase [uncultured Polaribacter sp.]|uniref:coproporphyrinogen III oxidase n=1 Tax=uncultured Polaribacter sp. TaxID=174711 RepID=UPI002625F3D6|nr:coproporphyrinogen III oxidase [uncultured Polaribacter sp.]